jgi:hypothetical protein
MYHCVLVHIPLCVDTCINVRWYMYQLCALLHWYMYQCALVNVSQRVATLVRVSPCVATCIIVCRYVGVCITMRWCVYHCVLLRVFFVSKLLSPAPRLLPPVLPPHIASHCLVKSLYVDAHEYHYDSDVC